MRKFFTKQRLYIILLGIIISGIFFFIAANQNIGSFSSSIFENLIASALTISFTAAVVDWLWERERYQQTVSAYQNAIKVLSSAEEDFTAYLAETLGFEAVMRGLHGPKLKNKYLHSPPGLIRIMSYLDDLDFKDLDSIKKIVDLDKLKKLVKSTENLIQTIDNVITLYGYALPVELKNDLLVYRQHVTDFIDMHTGEYDDKPDTVKNRIIYTAMLVYEPIKVFNQVLIRNP